MNLQDAYLWSKQAMAHMEQHTSEGMDTEAQISYAIAYQTLRCYHNAILSCLQLASSSEEEYEGFLRTNYPLKETGEEDTSL